MALNPGLYLPEDIKFGDCIIFSWEKLYPAESMPSPDEREVWAAPCLCSEVLLRWPRPEVL